MKGCQSPKVDVLELDLASLKSVKRFCKQFNNMGLSMDLVICNAGIMKPPKRVLTQDGFEGQFQVTHLVQPYVPMKATMSADWRSSILQSCSQFIVERMKIAVGTGPGIVQQETSEGSVPLKLVVLLFLCRGCCPHGKISCLLSMQMIYTHGSLLLWFQRRTMTKPYVSFLPMTLVVNNGFVDK